MQCGVYVILYFRATLMTSLNIEAVMSARDLTYLDV